MYTTSQKYKDYIASANRQFEVQAIIDNIIYASDEVVEFSIEDTITCNEELTIGTIIPAKLSIKIKTTNTIASNAKVELQLRLNGTNGYTEWIPMGCYYIDTRKYSNGVWTFECVDKLITSEQPYTTNLTYPCAMADVFAEILNILNLQSDVIINPAFQIPYKDENISVREMLSCIASAHGANVKLNRDEKLIFVPLASAAHVTTITASNYIKAEQTNVLKTFTRLEAIINSESETVIRGTGDADHTLNFENRFMFLEQVQADYAFSVINNFSYTPYNINWTGRPDLDVGDTIKIISLDTTEITTIIAINKISFKGGLLQNSSAPSKSEQQNEYKFQGNLSKQIQQKITKDVPYYGVSFGPSQGIKIMQSDGKSEAIFNSDIFTMRALEDGVMKDKLYFDPINNKYIFDGELSANAISAIEANIDVVVSNTTIIQNLYTEYGRIANLSVSELNTSWKKITNYLINNTDDVNYIKIYEKYMQWITASTGGASDMQITDNNNNLLYWTDETHSGMTLVDTGYPVLIYAYVETVKFDMTFESEDPQAVKMTFGAGFGYTNPDEGKGFLYKDATGMLIKYVQAGGNVLELRLGDDGIRQVGNNASNGIRNICMNTDPPENPENNDIWIDTNSNEFEESVLSKVIKVGAEQNIKMQIWAGNLEIFIDGAESPTWYIPLTPVE